MTDLNKISFGAPAAERDIKLGLLDYFVDSEAYRRVAAREKTLLLGNRGSGKSAIFKVLAQREKLAGAVVLELSPEDYSYEMLRKTLASEGDGAWAKHGAFSAAWKYLILVLVMKALDKAMSGLRTGPSRRIYEYLRDHHIYDELNPIATLISYLKRMEGLKIGTYEAAVKTQELASLYKLAELEPLKGAITELCAKRKVCVFIDELDKGWDSSEDAQAFVSGLVQAANSLNELSPRLTIYVSLRRELYESIPALYDDAQKYRDIIETVIWDEPHLLSMIANRIRRSDTTLAEASDLAAWSSVFAESIEYRKSKSFNYIVDRTLYRPRELIQFCMDCVDSGKVSPNDPINYSTISQSELGYSESRTKDIAAEYKFQYPGLLSVFEVFRGRAYSLTRVELDNLCLEIVTGGIAVGDAKWISDLEPEQLVDVLWRVGFLRAYAVGGMKALRRSGSSYLGAHQVASLNLRSLSRFQVHPMFRSYLGLKESKGQPDEPEE